MGAAMKAHGHKSLSYLLSGLFGLALPFVSPGAEAQTDPQGTVDLLKITSPSTDQSRRLPGKAEGLNIRPKVAQKFYERTIADSPFREGKLDWNLLMQLIKDKHSTPIALKLLEGVVIEFTPEEEGYKPLSGKQPAGGQKHRWSGRVTQKGKVVGDGLFIIDENLQRITATIQHSDKIYEIVSLGNGNVRISEFKADRFPTEEYPRVRPSPAPPRPDAVPPTPRARPPRLPHAAPRPDAAPPMHSARSECGDPPYLIDVLILYTEDAQKTWRTRGYGDILMEFTKAIEKTNEAFENSHIHAKVQIADTKLVPSNRFQESRSLETDLGKLRAPQFLGRTVAGWRDKAGADLVSLWVSGGDWCGAAPYFTNRGPRLDGADGFSVVVADCATNQFSFAHEIGHNLGARHTRDDEMVTPDNPAHNFGHRSVADGVQTLEARRDECPNCRRVSHYSNPDISYPGLTTKTGISIGSANAADNHAQLNATACQASVYRSPPE